MPLLDIQHLTVTFPGARGSVRAVDDITLQVSAGETLGLVGESGSGKSITAFSIVRLLPPAARIESGRVFFEGRDLLALPEPEMRGMRGARISLIFQEPMTALNPVMRVGDQIAEALTVHGETTANARRRAVELLDAVRIPNAASRSFSIEEGEMYGLVGESGSGKSTTGRCILRLVEPTRGTVLFRGEDVVACSAPRMRALRRDMQIVFQDPYSSLNPRMRVRDIIEEPLIIHAVGSRDERRARVTDLLGMVGLEAAHGARYPHEFSGGQRQRIGIARALALNPAFVIADEAVSALDVSIQAQVVELLVELKERLNLTFLFIAHDLRLVEDICGRVAVMYRGRIVEMGATRSVFASPAHPYTRALLSAVPSLDPDARRTRIELDPASFDQQALLKELGEGHWAAV